MKTKKECPNELGILHNRYLLIENIGHGYSSDVYLVKDLKENNKEYALKLFKKFSCYNNEKVMNEIITKSNNSSFVKYITSSVGYIIKDGSKEIRPYITFELCSKGNIAKYISCNKTGLDEKNCKIILSKMIEILKALHKMDICHRDIKLNNFLFYGENYTIKLCDFGFSTKIPRNEDGEPLYLKGKYGTREYKAPEINQDIPYNGEKIDIFSLGVVLFNLRVGFCGFSRAMNDKNPKDLLDIAYSYIKNKKYDCYWKIIDTCFHVKGLTTEFKELYQKMVADNPKERPTLEEIYNDKWMKEIRDLNEKELEECENDLIKVLKNREEIINMQTK